MKSPKQPVILRAIDGQTNVISTLFIILFAHFSVFTSRLCHILVQSISDFTKISQKIVVNFPILFTASTVGSGGTYLKIDLPYFFCNFSVHKHPSVC